CLEPVTPKPSTCSLAVLSIVAPNSPVLRQKLGSRNPLASNVYRKGRPPNLDQAYNPSPPGSRERHPKLTTSKYFTTLRVATCCGAKNATQMYKRCLSVGRAGQRSQRRT